MSEKTLDIDLIKNNLGLLVASQPEHAEHDITPLMDLVAHYQPGFDSELNQIVEIAATVYDLSNTNFDPDNINILEEKRRIANTATITFAPMTTIKYKSLHENLINLPTPEEMSHSERAWTKELAQQHLESAESERKYLNRVAGVMLFAPALIISLLANENFEATQRMYTMFAVFTAASWYNHTSIAPRVSEHEDHIKLNTRIIRDYDNVENPDSIPLIQLIKSAANIHSTY